MFATSLKSREECEIARLSRGRAVDNLRAAPASVLDETLGEGWYGRVRNGIWFGGTDPMATIEILSGDFERETTRIRWSEAGRAHLRLTSIDGTVEDLFLENEVVGAAEAGGDLHGGPHSRGGGRSERLFVVLLRGGRKFVARGDFDAFVQFECAALPADRRRERLTSLQAAHAATRVDEARSASWFGASLFARLLPHR